MVARTHVPANRLKTPRSNRLGETPQRPRAEELLRELAYVLHIARQVRNQIVREQAARN